MDEHDQTEEQQRIAQLEGEVTALRKHLTARGQPPRPSRIPREVYRNLRGVRDRELLDAVARNELQIGDGPEVERAWAEWLKAKKRKLTKAEWAAGATSLAKHAELMAGIKAGELEMPD